MDSLYDIKAKRKLQQQIMAKALMTPATVAPGENPVNAFQPLLQILGSKLQDRKLGQQEDLAQKSQAEELANALSLGQGTQGIPATRGNPEQPAVPGNREAMFRALMGSNDPTLQGYGAKGIFEKPQSEYTLGEIGAPGDKRQSVFYNKFDPSKTINAGVATRPPSVQAAVLNNETRTNLANNKLAQKGQMPAQALKMQQEELDAIGTASSINADLNALGNQLDQGKLTFGPVSNTVNKLRNATGMSTDESKNFESFQSTLEKLRNDSLRLNKGVQTEGDAQRAWNEIISNINDPGVVKQRLQEVQRINERAANLRKMNVDVIRMNYGLDSMETEGYQNQAPAVGSKGGLQKNPDGSYNYVPR